MGRLTRALWRQFRSWDRAARVAFMLVLVLLLPVIFTVASGPAALRQPALIGLVGLIIMGQIIFMWANRHMVTPYGQAQRLYLREDFEGACAVLEKLRDSGEAGVRALTLLGNAYRQRGLLDQSETVLLEALNIQPDHHFPLYGFGRTLLIQGRYTEAARAIQQALECGAVPVVGLDAAEACYRSGQQEEARQWLEQTLPLLTESYRQLMAQYLLYCTGHGNRPAGSLVKSGLYYWQAQSQRYSDSPYGQALAEDVRAMETLAEEA